MPFHGLKTAAPEGAAVQKIEGVAKIKTVFWGIKQMDPKAHLREYQREPYHSLN